MFLNLKRQILRILLNFWKKGSMGCDGGTIPTRDELVKTKKKPEQKDKDSVRLFKWQHCHLSHQKLSRPIVACQLGFLYNKEAIIEKLLDSRADQEAGTSNGNDTAGHIKSLKVFFSF